MNSRQRRKRNRNSAPSSERRSWNGRFEVRGEGDDATISVAITSEAPVRRAFGMEILDHTPSSIDMSRAKNGLPLILQHQHRGPLPVGRVDNIRVDPDKVLRGDTRFSRREDAQAVRQDVLDRIATDVSGGYEVDTKQVRKTGDTYRFMRWKPVEVSVVSVPADESVGFHRNDEGTPVDEPTQDPAEEHPQPVNAALQIREAFDPFIARDGVAELQRQLIADGKTEREAMAALLDHIGKQGNPEPGAAASVMAGEDAIERFARGAENALVVRSGLGTDEDVTASKENPYTSYSMVELARAWLSANNIDGAGLNAAGIIARAIDPGTANLTTTDFPQILENVMNKALFRGFDEADRTWDQWCSVNSVTDFKPYTRPGLSHFTSLAVVTQNTEIQDGIRNDKKEGGQILTYARKLSLTREAMVNDDLSAFSDNARAMGEAAQRTVDENVYTLLESNPTMGEDATALFDNVGHGNNPVAGAPPDEAGIIAAKVAMSAQVDSNSVLLGIRPRIALGPIELEDTLIKLSTAEFSPDGSANPFEPNSVRNTFVPLSTARLTDKEAWYMFGARGQTCEVNFLNGQRQPSLERDTGWSTFAMHWRVWIDFDPLFLDWRAAYKNNGT